MKIALMVLMVVSLLWKKFCPSPTIVCILAKTKQFFILHSRGSGGGRNEMILNRKRQNERTFKSSAFKSNYCFTAWGLKIKRNYVLSHLLRHLWLRKRNRKTHVNGSECCWVVKTQFDGGNSFNAAKNGASVYLWAQ